MIIYLGQDSQSALQLGEQGWVVADQGQPRLSAVQSHGSEDAQRLVADAAHTVGEEGIFVLVGGVWFANLLLL
jgi:hypothetical protein